MRQGQRVILCSLPYLLVQNNEEIKKAELEARRRVYFFHRKVAVIGLLVALGMLILGVAGIGNGLTWTIFVISSFAACVGGWEMIEPDIK